MQIREVRNMKLRRENYCIVQSSILATFGRLCVIFAERLLRAADKHDCTKIDGIDQFHKDFRQVQQQGGNFKELPWYRCHVAEERHHLTDRVPDDVNLLDVLEWVADITMAGMARHGAVLPDSLSPEVLLMAYQNTITQLKNEIKVED